MTTKATTQEGVADTFVRELTPLAQALMGFKTFAGAAVLPGYEDKANKLSAAVRAHYEKQARENFGVLMNFSLDIKAAVDRQRSYIWRTYAPKVSREYVSQVLGYNVIEGTKMTCTVKKRDRTYIYDSIADKWTYRVNRDGRWVTERDDNLHALANITGKPTTVIVDEYWDNQRGTLSGIVTRAVSDLYLNGSPTVVEEHLPINKWKPETPAELKKKRSKQIAGWSSRKETGGGRDYTLNWVVSNGLEFRYQQMNERQMENVDRVKDFVVKYHLQTAVNRPAGSGENSLRISHRRGGLDVYGNWSMTGHLRARFALALVCPDGSVNEFVNEYHLPYGQERIKPTGRKPLIVVNHILDGWFITNSLALNGEVISPKTRELLDYYKNQKKMPLVHFTRNWEMMTKEELTAYLSQVADDELVYDWSAVEDKQEYLYQWVEGDELPIEHVMKNAIPKSEVLDAFDSIAGRDLTNLF